MDAAGLPAYGLGHGCGLRRIVDQPQPVAQPFDGGTGDEDAALQGVGGLPVQAVGDGGQQAVAAAELLGAGVGQEKAAGAVGAFAIARPAAALADQRRLLVPGHAEDGDFRAEPFGVRHAEGMGAVADFRQHGRGNVVVGQQFGVPFLAADVEELGSGGVGGVGGLNAALGQPPEQEAVHGAEAKLPRGGAAAEAGNLVEQPGELGAGEVRVQHQAGLGPHPVRQAVRSHARAAVGGAPVLPNDGVVQALAGGALPNQGGLPLVGDADGGDVLGRHRRGGNGGPARLQGGAPEHSRGLLHPAVLGEDQVEGALPRSQNAAGGQVEDDAAGA